jgi:hypothetical protein
VSGAESQFGPVGQGYRDVGVSNEAAYEMFWQYDYAMVAVCWHQMRRAEQPSVPNTSTASDMLRNTDIVSLETGGRAGPFGAHVRPGARALNAVFEEKA